MRKSFVYRLYPNKAQSDKLDSHLNTARGLYNSALQERRDAWKCQRKSLNYYDQARELKELRRDIPEVAELNFSATQDILRRLDKSFKAFFRRIEAGEKAGYPRFKRSDRFNSITFPVYGDGIKLRDDRLYVQNIGLVKIKMHRPLEGEINTVTVKRDCGKWYVSFSNTVEIKLLSSSNKEVGIDVGLEYFATLPEGEPIQNPRYLREAETTLSKAQRKISRRKKGGRNRRKAVALLAQHHQRVRNQRADFAHKEARKIVTNYGYIAVEDLKIKNMVHNRHLAKSISDASWGVFMDCIAYKAEEAGRIFTRVSPNGTSQTCAFCGTTVPKSLSVRTHNCPHCGISVPRDFNSALNILALGRSVWDVTCASRQSVSQEAVCFS